MSRLVAGHVREMPLEFSVEAEYVWLTQKKAEWPNMSGLGAGHVRPKSLKFG
jgi:hypothetical protein